METNRFQVGLKSGAVMVLQAPVTLVGASSVQVKDWETLAAAITAEAGPRFMSALVEDRKSNRPHLIRLDAIEYITELPGTSKPMMGFGQAE